MELAVAGVGSLVILGDYLDRKLSLGHDLKLMGKLGGLQKEIKRLTKDNLTAADYWEETVKKNSNHVALVFEGKKYTFKEMEENINRFAHWASSKGLKKGDVAALYMENRPEFLFTWFGLTKIGVVVALINYNLIKKGLAHCLKVSNSRYLIFGVECQSSIAESLDTFQEEGLQIGLGCYGGEVPFAEHIDPQIANHSPEKPPRSIRKGIKATDTWSFIYTSGTTGLPKAAIIRHVRLSAGALFTVMYDLTVNDRIYVTLPLYHASAGIIGVGALVFGGVPLALRRKFSASNFFQDIAEYECTAFLYIGELCRYLLNTNPTPWDKKHNLRVAIGNGLRPDIWEAFQTRFNIPTIGEFYAATEGNISFLNTVGLDGEGRGAVGRMGWLMRKALKVKVVKFDVETETPVRGPDGFCIECAPDEIGELLSQIDDQDPLKAFPGYHGNKEGTEKKILRDAFAKGDKFFRTGDLLKHDSKGYFYFIDRIGDTFRWKGENVSTMEVAAAMSVYPGVKEANVYGVEVPGTEGRAGMAALVADENIDLKGLGQYLSTKLPPYSIPLFLRVTPEMAITGTFKHQKVELRNQGFDPARVTDPLYYLNPSTKSYEPLDGSGFQSIVSGKAKL